MAFCLDLRQQLVDQARVVNSHEPAENPAPLPPKRRLRLVAEPLRAEDAESDVTVALQVRNAGEISADVQVAQVGEEWHRFCIPRSGAVTRLLDRLDSACTDPRRVLSTPRK